MMGRTHGLGGVASLWVLMIIPGAITYHLDWTNAGLLASLASLGALIPDLDSPYSTLSPIFPFSVLQFFISRMFGHRGRFHSLWSWGVVTVLVGLPLIIFTGVSMAAAFSLGYLSHLVLDCLTVKGLTLFWPNPQRIHFLPPDFRIRTNTYDESSVSFLFGSLAVVLLILILFQMIFSAWQMPVGSP